ncbi:MAG: ATP-grasp domain-containing protein [Actinomycetota bacterium]
MVLLLAGGENDPNLVALKSAANRAGVECVELRISAAQSPAFCWNPQERAPRLFGRELNPGAAFIRYDVFAGMADPRPEVNSRALAWYQTVMGWLLSAPRIRIFNRDVSQIAANKPASLILAREAGLQIPATVVTNEVENFSAGKLDSLVAKPVAGGDYCYPLADAVGKAELRGGLAAVPAIVQNRLVPPEVRIYVVGQSAFAFEVRSSSLDYRVNQDAELILLPKVPQEVSMLRKLMSRLRVDFGAADFKTDRDTGQLLFLELNTSPMFARFDEASEGRLCAAMVRELAEFSSPDVSTWK